ncbi:hypothetical protein CROQUDRAFT_105699 [Cronartium quercuum f. sp. fusiforme G11]|uniref:Uncharacterized protein n=1 Tax=Cronartium quercuum f. sp. fusiforme G11 TaxID=708437 RepID=A0A9P6NQY7_9BASI|nr:hypothetical protein CROQUDRAFT_105699 [Cronartium quercuum f. sp. fusiforme G11]
MTPGTYVHPSTRRNHLAKRQAVINQEIDLANSFKKISLQNSPKVPSTSARNDPEAVVEPEVLIEPSFVLFFIAWLHLICGLSHQRCQQAIVYITYIIKHIHQLKRQVDFHDQIPKDIHTITKHLGLDVELEEFMPVLKTYFLLLHSEKVTVCQELANIPPSALKFN